MVVQGYRRQADTSCAEVLRLFGEDLGAFRAYRREDDGREKERRQGEHCGADRADREDARVATRQEEGAAQVLLHEWPEDEAEEERRRLAAELHEDVAEDAEERG